MREKSKRLFVAAIAGMIGGGLGSVSGSNNLFVVFSVAGISAALIAWIVNGMIR